MTCHRRQPGPVATLLWFVFFVALIPASFQTPGMWWLGLSVAIVLVLGTLGRLAQHQERRRRPVVQRQPGPSLEDERQGLLRRIDAMRADLDRRRFRARCDHCGAPRTHEANACRYCGRSLVAG